MSKILTILLILGIAMLLGGYFVPQTPISLIGAIIVVIIGVIYTLTAIINFIKDVF